MSAGAPARGAAVDPAAAGRGQSGAMRYQMSARNPA